MRFIRGAKIGLLLACLPMVSVGCASLSPKLSVLPSAARNWEDSQYQAALRAEESGQLETARELYGSLQKHSPNASEYAHRMAVVCTRLNDHATAVKYFEHARSLDPKNPRLLADMGYSAYLQKDYANAESLLCESVQLRAGDPRAINNLAMAIGYQGRYDECLAMFRQVNTETQSQLNLAFIQSQRSDLDLAIATYQRILSNEPGNKIAANAVKGLTAAQSRLAAATTKQHGGKSNASTPPPQVSIAATGDSKSSALEFDAPLIIPNGDRGIAASTGANLPNDQLGEPMESPVRQPIAKNDLVNIFEGDDNAPESVAKRNDELDGLEWLSDELTRKKADVASPSTADCLRGFCPVALRDERRLAGALDDYSIEYQAQTYRFSSAEARDKFLEHPDLYVPAAGGLDVIEVKRGHAVVPGSLDFACWFRDRLHLFSSPENLAAFRATPREFVASN